VYKLFVDKERSSGLLQGYQEYYAYHEIKPETTETDINMKNGVFIFKNQISFILISVSVVSGLISWYA